jgi:hypothetical protein
MDQDKLLKLPDFDPEVAVAPGGRRSRLTFSKVSSIVPFYIVNVLGH